MNHNDFLVVDFLDRTITEYDGLEEAMPVMASKCSYDLVRINRRFKLISGVTLSKVCKDDLNEYGRK